MKYPTLVHDGSAGPARVRTELDIREVSAAEVAAARDGLGEAMWRDATDRPHHIYHGESIPGLL